MNEDKNGMRNLLIHVEDKRAEVEFTRRLNRKMSEIADKYVKIGRYPSGDMLRHLAMEEIRKEDIEENREARELEERMEREKEEARAKIILKAWGIEK